MGFRNIAILFLSVTAVSMVLLVVVVSFIFQGNDMSFETKMPEAAPELADIYKNDDAAPEPNDLESGEEAATGLTDPMGNENTTTAEGQEPVAEKQNGFFLTSSPKGQTNAPRNPE